MKKLISIVAALGLMATMITPAFAATQDVPDADGTTTPFVNVDNVSPMDVYATTLQTDTYKATINWGLMTFAYNFGTWNAETHQWSNASESGWNNAAFIADNADITVTNHSSQPITAAFHYDADLNGTNNGTATVGSFTTVGGNLNNTGSPGIATNTMELALCEISGTPDSDTTFLNLVGPPKANIGNTSAAEIGQITVTLNEDATPLVGAVAELAKITDVAVTTVPSGTADTLAGVNAAMLLIANGLVGEDYAVTLAAGSTYNAVTNAWTGRFTVTNDVDPLDTSTDTALRTITVIIAE
ncbi:hypothetical protein [Acetobacterium sp.]|uniref:hypothetical protein n=1 Tax=Acetobacterium sp. TaxID=1872094 RepID=UPI002F3E521D